MGALSVAIRACAGTARASPTAIGRDRDASAHAIIPHHSRGFDWDGAGMQLMVAPGARFRSLMTAFAVNGRGWIAARRPAGQGGRARARPARRASLAL